MVEYENICLGAIGYRPSPNHKIISQSEYNERLARNLAEYHKMSIEEVKEYMYG